MSTRNALLVFVIIVSTTLAATATAAPNPLAAISGLQNTLGKGMNAVIKGGAPKAFAPLAAVAKKPFGPELRTAGVASVRLLAMEFELVFFSAGKPTYYLRSAVGPTKQGPAFVELKGREVKEQLYVKPHPLRDYKGPAAPLATVAQAVTKALTAKDCSSRIPIAPNSEFAYLPPNLASRATRDLERTRSSLPEQCSKVAALKHSSVELRVDDVVFAALGQDGKMVGMIKGGLELTGDKLTFAYGKFRPNPTNAPGR